MYQYPMVDEFNDQNGDINKFVPTLEEIGFIVQEAELRYLDVSTQAI